MTYLNKNSERIYFNIHQVAKQIDVVPATLRNWEKAGLFIPKRLENNYRVYTMDDLAILKRIARLSVNEKISYSAIKTAIYGDSALPPIVQENKITSSKYSKKLINSKWKNAREHIGLSIDTLSKRSGIDTNYLTALENGTAAIDIQILSELALFYGESILNFFEIESTDIKVVKKGKGEQIKVGLPGVSMESLITQSKHILYPMKILIKPGCGSLEPHCHKGEEYIYVLSGELQVILGENNIHEIKKGDSMYFRSNEKHSWKNSSIKDTVLIWVHSPVEPI